jgi:hypothetical protein
MRWGQCEVAQLVTEQQLDAGVAADDASELAVALGFLGLVREAGQRREADAASLVAGADRQGCGQHRLASSRVADEDHTLAVIDPGALGQRGDRGLGTLGLSAKRKPSSRLICGNRASISRRFSRRSARSAISACSSAPRSATGSSVLSRGPQAAERFVHRAGSRQGSFLRRLRRRRGAALTAGAGAAQNAPTTSACPAPGDR